MRGRCDECEKNKGIVFILTELDRNEDVHASMVARFCSKKCISEYVADCYLEPMED